MAQLVTGLLTSRSSINFCKKQRTVGCSFSADIIPIHPFFVELSIYYTTAKYYPCYQYGFQQQYSNSSTHNSAKQKQKTLLVCKRKVKQQFEIEFQNFNKEAIQTFIFGHLFKTGHSETASHFIFYISTTMTSESRKKKIFH